MRALDASRGSSAGVPRPSRSTCARGVVGRPRDWSFQAHLTGRFRLKSQGSWMAPGEIQYNVAPADIASPLS